MAKTGLTSDRRLYLDKDGKVVEHDNPAKASLLVAQGGLLLTEDAAKYGITMGADGKLAYGEAVSEVEPVPANDENPEAVEEAPKPLRGKLPEDFPGFKALEEAGITTYAQVRKAGDLTEIKGIGDATAASIAAALEATPEAEE